MHRLVLSLFLVSALFACTVRNTPDATVLPLTQEAPVEVGEKDGPASTVTPENPISPLTGVEGSLLDRVVLERVAQMGVSWVRLNGLLWSEVELQQGARNWEALASLEQELLNAVEIQSQVILVVRSTPPWAQAVPGSLCGPILVDKLPAFANFMHDLVARYSLPPYNVKYWELGNEPDIDPSLVPSEYAFGCWGKIGDPYYGGGYYAEMLKAVYPQIKAADPQAQVLVGGLLMDCDPTNPPQGRDCTPSRYLEGVLHNGGGDFFDGVSFHAYDYYSEPFRYGNPNWHSSSEKTGPVVVAKARFLHSLLESYGYPDKYLMNTEAGLLCGSSGYEELCQAEAYSLTKSYYLAESNASALSEGLSANVWHSLLGWRGTALLDGELNLLPASEAMRVSSGRLKGASFGRVIDEFSPLRGYEMWQEGRRVWFLWSWDGEKHSLRLPSMPVEIYDVFGERLEPVVELEIGPEPVYIIY